MTTKMSAQMGGFTPIFDIVVKDVGIVGAGVFGRIWRYCQGSRGVCQATLETIASDLNISRRTVIRWTGELCKAGYLEDSTPDLRNRPHTYCNTGKVKIQVEINAVTESHPIVTESHLESDRKSLEETRRDKRRETPPQDGDLPDELFPEQEPTTPIQSAGDHSVLDHTDPIAMMAHCVEKRDQGGGAPDWAMRTEGIHPMYPVLVAFCKMTQQGPHLLTAKQGKRWLTRYIGLARKRSLTPTDMLQAHEFLPDKDRGAWYIENHKWSTPYSDSYEAQLMIAATQVKSGTVSTKNSWAGVME